MMRKVLTDSVAIVSFAFLTGLGGMVQFPFQPNHVFTLQLLFPPLAGAFLGRDKGALSQILFILLSISIVPFFNVLAVGLPAPVLGASPTFTRLGLKTGYLLGYIAAAYLVGSVIEEKKLKDFRSLALTMASGVILIYLTGLASFIIVFKIPLSAFFFRWTLPFFLLDLMKAVFATLIYWRTMSIYRYSIGNPT